MATKKEEFLVKMKKQLDDLNYRWNNERNKFEARAQHKSADARRLFETEWEALHKKRKQLKDKIAELESASESAWGEIKAGTDTAWKSLSEAFKKATSHFKDK